MYRIGVDIGGTFTDVVLAKEDGRIVREKFPTNRDDYTAGIVSALDRACRRVEDSLDSVLANTLGFVNGSTVVTNAIAELRGRKVGLLTTRGFKQQIRIHRGTRQVELDLQKDIAPPDIVRLPCIGEVDERVDRQGNVLVPLDAEQVRKVADELVQRQGVSALAICFLWSFRYPEHERAAAAAIRGDYPELFVTLSSEVYPRLREYERMNTAVLNSFVSEGADNYISRLSTRLADSGLPTGRLTFMQSLGGQLSIEEARREPVRLMHSGPAGGVIAATHFAKELGLRNVVTADVGGTSFDTALLMDGRIPHAHRTRVNRLLTGLSTLDITAIGAGGGSIAWIDNRGVPQVGPTSAGSEPGPACYGRGGQQPTLTDVALVLGLIDPDNFWGGSMSLDMGAAQQAIRQEIAKPLGRDVQTAAAGLFEIAVSNMSNAMSGISIAQGFDPREFTVIAYGGAGGLFIAEVCSRLGVSHIVLPRSAATFSAYGLLFSDAIRSASTTAEWPIDTGDVSALSKTYRDLEHQATSALRTQGFSDSETAIIRQADLKFVGQAFDVSMDMPSYDVTDSDRDSLNATFYATYERLYGPATAWHGFPVLLETARVIATGTTRKPAIPQVARDEASPDTLLRGERKVDLLPYDQAAVKVYEGSDMGAGMAVDGPVIAEDKDTTVYVPPHWQLSIDALGNYVLDMTEGDAA